MPFDEFVRDRLEEMEERGYKIGIEKGINVVIRAEVEKGKSKDEIIKILEENFEFSKEEAESYYNRFEEEENMEELEERGYQAGIDKSIKIIIRDNIEEGKTKDVIVKKLEKYFELDEEEAESYYNRFADEENVK